MPRELLGALVCVVFHGCPTILRPLYRACKKCSPLGPVPSPLLTLPFVLASLTVFLAANVPNLFLLASRYLGARGFNEQEIGVVMGAFHVASLLTMPLHGRLIERLGRQVHIPASCLLAAAGCVGFELADTVPFYAAARAAQGIGFAGVLVGVVSYVAEIAPRERLAQALGFAGVLTLVSQAVGPSLGELLERTAGWPWVFRAGAIGAGLSAGIAALLAPARRAEEAGDEDAEPGRAWPALLATALAGVGFGSIWTFLAAYAGRVGVSAVTPFFVPYVIAAVSARLFLGHLADTVGRRAVAVPSLLCAALALALLAGLGALWHLVPIGLLFGLAHGLSYPTLQAIIVERAGGRARSRAVARSTFSFGLGIALGAFTLGALAKVAGYPAIYLVAAGVSVLAAAILAARR